MPATIPQSQARPTILLVDDNEAFREITAMGLRSRGYDAEVCASPEAALERASDGAPFQILMTDVVMANMTGVELATQIRRLLPHIQVLFCSGYPEAALAKQGLHISGGRFLMKPISLGALSSKIEELLTPLHAESSS